MRDVMTFAHLFPRSGKNHRYSFTEGALLAVFAAGSWACAGGDEGGGDDDAPGSGSGGIEGAGASDGSGGTGGGDGEGVGGTEASGSGGGSGTGGQGGGAALSYCDRWFELASGELPGFATDSVCHDFAAALPGDAACTDEENSTAEIVRVELAQNHVLEVSADDYTQNEGGEPLESGSVRPQFRLISHRPALLLVTVTGSGVSPDVRVQASRDGEVLGSFCLSGPEALPAVAPEGPELASQFSVTLPAAWIRDGLSLEIVAGPSTRLVPAGELRVAGGTRHIVMEGSMALYGLPPRTVPRDDPDTYLMADELPVQSAVWAHFPVPIVMDPMTMSARSGNPARILSSAEGGFDEVGECLDIFSEIRRANGHIEDTGYYAALPDGWGGGLGGGNGSAGPASQLMIRHEGGHAYGLPHLEDAYADGRYPFAKRTNGSGCVLGVPGEDGCGVGPAWKYFQTQGVFESPWEDQGAGVYKRDPMAGGGNNWFGAYTDQWLLDYFKSRPFFDLEAGEYLRYDEETGEFVSDTEVPAENWYRRPVLRDVPLYTFFGSYSEDTEEVNVIQPPLHYRGHLLKTMDPTDETHLTWLRENSVSDACQNDCDFTLRVTFEDETEVHVLINRNAGAYTRWAVNVPDLGTPTQLELFRRDLNNGNVDATTAVNFFDSAVLVASRAL